LEFGNESVLQGPKEPLDPPLGLRRQGVDGFNGKLLQSPSYLGGILPAPKLLLKAPMRVIALKGAVAVLIDGKGDPIVSYHLVQDPQIGLRGFKGEKPRCQTPTGSIIDGCNETTRGMALSKPRVNRAIPQHHHPLLGLASPAGSMPGRTPPPLGKDASLPANPSCRLPTDANPFDCGKLLGKMSVIEQSVLGPRQLHNLLPELHTNGIGRPSPRIAVDKPRRTIPGSYPLETLGMPITHLHPSTGLSQ